ncbi:Serine/threonine-protein kinase 36 [Chytriomyces hyalinus]|nr:Serine/threonine-protein kinase 36 [Chytriomyces hyalinus]
MQMVPLRSVSTAKRVTMAKIELMTASRKRRRRRPRHITQRDNAFNNYHNTHTHTNTQVALKLINLTGRSKQDLKALRDEIKCHRRLIHPNIVRCLDSFITREPNEEVAVITELCPHGDLMDALKLVGKFEEDRVRVFARDLAAGLEFLHVKQNMIHRDLKLQNILISSTGVLKICDFGFSHLFEQSGNLALTSVKGTPIYMAPELIQETPYSRLVDIWALGVIIYELSTGLPPFYTTNIFKLIEMILHAQVSYPETMSESLQSLLHGLLQKSPDVRLNWPKLAHHPFLIEDVVERGEMDPQDAVEGLKKDRPTTTDSGVDMSSAKTRKPSKNQEWREIDGLELPASNTLNVVKENNKSTESELGSVQWNELLLETATHAGLSSILMNNFKCSNVFKSLISFPTVFDADSFQSTFSELKDALIVVQRLFVMIGTRNNPAPELDIADQIRITSRWLCSLTHGLLQLDSASPQDMNVSYALELTLQLLCDVIQTHVNLSSKSSDIQSAATKLAQLLIQMYLPILSRILYTSINTSQVSESLQSSITDQQNEKWVPVLVPAINAARHLFHLFHVIPKLDVTLSNLYSDVVELGVLYSLADFVHEFFVDGSKTRLNVVVAVLWALEVLVAPNVESVVQVCLMDGGQLVLASWGRVLCETEKALLLNSECMLNVAVELLALSTKKRNDSGIISTAILCLLATVAKSSQAFANRLCQTDSLVSAAYTILSRNSDKNRLVLASLECLNSLSLSKLSLEEHVPMVLQVLQFCVQEDVQGAEQVAVISGLMQLLVSTTPTKKIGALEEYFVRILKLGLLDTIQQTSDESNCSHPSHSVSFLHTEEQMMATVIAFLSTGLTRFATVVLPDFIVNSDAILALLQRPSLLHSIPCARVKARVVELLCDAKLHHFIRTAPTTALSSHIKLTMTTKDPDALDTRRSIIEAIVTISIHEVHLFSYEYNKQQMTQILHAVTDSVSIVSSETVSLILPFLCGCVLQGYVSGNVDASKGILCRLFQQTRELGRFFWIHLMRSANCNEAKESALMLMDALVEGFRHRKDSVLVLESVDDGVQECLKEATGYVREKARKLSQKLELFRTQFT